MIPYAFTYSHTQHICRLEKEGVGMSDVKRILLHDSIRIYNCSHPTYLRIEKKERRQSLRLCENMCMCVVDYIYSTFRHPTHI